MEVHKRICNSCKQEKPITEYYKNLSDASGYQYKCKECARHERKIYYYAHKATENFSNKQYHKSNHKEIYERKQKYKKMHSDVITKQMYEHNHSTKGKFQSYKSHAREKGLSFELTYEQFASLLTKKCIYCGCSNNIGIDRVDNNLGYIIKNCASCCTMCNISKNKHSAEDYLKHCLQVVQTNHLR